MRHPLILLSMLVSLFITSSSAHAKRLEVHMINGLVEEVVLVKKLTNKASLNTGIGFIDLGYKHTLLRTGQWVGYIKHPSANQLAFQYLDKNQLNHLMRQANLSTLPSTPSRSLFLIEWVLLLLTIAVLVFKFKTTRSPETMSPEKMA